MVDSQIMVETGKSLWGQLWKVINNYRQAWAEKVQIEKKIYTLCIGIKTD